MRISLNLATRPYADLGPALKRLRIAMAALGVAAIVLGLGLRGLHQKADQARWTEQQVQNQIDGVNRERAGYRDMMLRPDNAQLLDQVATLNQLFDQKAFSWTLAIEDLETVLPAGVQVTNLEPVRAKDGPTTLRLRVVGPRDRAVELVSNLEHSRHFVEPRIVSESAESAGGPAARLEPVSASDRVNFDLLADYNPAASSERRAETARPGDEKPAASVPAPPPQAFGGQPGRTPYTGPAGAHHHLRRDLNPMPVPNPGGAR